VRIKEHKPKTPSHSTGLVATLRDYLCLQGSAAPSIALPRPRGCLAVALAFAFLALGPAPAQAAQPHAFLEQFGSPGSGAGQLQLTPESGLAVDQENGDLYVADTANHRVDEFSSTGAFLRAWGWDVVASGPDSGPGTDEVQTVTVAATAGTFTLAVGASTTASLPFDATAAELQAQLESLAPVGAGNVTVTGGPGDPTGSNPYRVTFVGALAATHLPKMTLDTSSLVREVHVGANLSCTAGPPGSASLTYKWLRNGVPIPGATESVYTTVAADASTALQCQVFAINANVGATQASSPFLVSPPPVTAPPMPPLAGGGQEAIEVERNPPGSRQEEIEIKENGTHELGEVGSSGGTTLTCTEARRWTGASTFAYQWYRNGLPLSGNGAGTETYTVQTADLATPAFFQCAVTAANADASASVTAVTKDEALAVMTKETDVGDENTLAHWQPPYPLPPRATATLVAGSVAVTAPAGRFQVCQASSGDLCQAGLPGAGLGQLTAPTYIAVDNTPGGHGDLYVADPATHLVQKFDSTGHLITAWGGSPGPGQISGGQGVGGQGVLKGVLVNPAGNLLVVDGTSTYEWSQSTGELLNPLQNGETGETEQRNIGFNSQIGVAPIGVAGDPAGRVYVGELLYPEGVRVSQNSLCNLEDPFGLCPEHNLHEGSAYKKNFTVDPGPATGVAVDPSTEAVYVASYNPISHQSDISAHDSEGNELEPPFGGNGEITNPGALAASGSAGSEGDVYLAEPGANRIEVFAPGGPRDSLTVTRAGTGLGSVASAPAVIACPFTCAASFPEGEVVTLTATAPEHSMFVGWSGGGCAGTGACQITFTAATAVTATFAYDRPVLTVAPAAAVTRHTAILTGTVNPEGDASSCLFEYGTTSAYGAQAPCSSHPGSGAGPVPVSAELWELATSTTYHYRLVSANSGGTSYGSDETLTTGSEGCASNAVLCPVLPAVASIATAAVVSPKPPVITTKALTNARKLTLALAVCRKHKQRSVRVKCEKQAQRRYAPAKTKPKKSTRSGKRG
jgi:hypothetical protein